ncbi:MAG: DUF89 domain-containing protein [Candidatus Hermodarchaeota archaeon]
MKLEPECIGCLFDQMLRAFKLLDPDISREKIMDAQMKLMEYLKTIDIDKNASPIIGKMTYGIVSETLGIDDPYKELKKKQNTLALELYRNVKKIVLKSKDPLFEAIIVSALGNTIDLAAQHKIDIIKDIKTFSYSDLVINDYPDFKTSLEQKDTILILGDNAGEIVFDKLLMEVLHDIYPMLQIIFSVRSSPVINDVTYEDAEFVGLTQQVKIVKASPTPGIELTTTSDEFKKYFFNPDIIILSKGQGNFESLYGLDIPSKDVYYLMKAKCNLMERIFNVSIGKLIFKKKREN